MISDQLDDMADAFSDVGVHFTCREADILVDLLNEVGANVAADALYEGHLRGDVPGDLHRADEVPDDEPLDMSGPGNPTGEGR